MTDDRLRTALAEVERHYGERLLAAALFGSRARERPRHGADWDLLLVLQSEEPIRRALYAEWERALEPRVEVELQNVSPHFVHLPRPQDQPTGFWIEVALSNEILSDRSGALAEQLDRIRRLVRDGRFEAGEVHGLRYWRRAG